LLVEGYPTQGSPLYAAGLSSGDVITAVNGVKPSETTFAGFNSGTRVQLGFVQRGVARNATVVLLEDPGVEVVTFEDAGVDVTPEVAERRRAWLSSRAG
jgi:predicted metalloprotease with PDZ domain